MKVFEKTEVKNVSKTFVSAFNKEKDFTSIHGVGATFNEKLLKL